MAQNITHENLGTTKREFLSAISITEIEHQSTFQYKSDSILLQNSSVTNERKNVGT